MAELLKVQMADVEAAKSKALAEKEDIIRQKAYDQGTSLYKYHKNKVRNALSGMGLKPSQRRYF